ncbi:hypothetical protein [Legionella septentrionalis]|uniref:hypothetical protein n=1 Tax=Legionella septentrionalis TaxID=2498109 RepID=UPI001F3C83F8|nr:hypothetical protein [Legionella septentrionalis]
MIGRIITKDGEYPLANTWIYEGKNGIFSDDEGNFQLELTQDTKTLMAGESCRINLPALAVDKAYLYLGEIRCS